MAEQRLFKELELGFRELFRILIPGAFVVSLAQAVFPDAQFTLTITRSTTSGLAATFFCGLVGYALRAHERWFPYFIQFEKKRAELNAEIARITNRKLEQNSEKTAEKETGQDKGKDNEKDNVDVYKYFLETQAEEMNDRIHYFSSFYYMLVELSLFSMLGALLLFSSFLFRSAHLVSPFFVDLGASLIVVAFVVQLSALFPLTGVRTLRTKIGLYCATSAVVLALGLLAATSYIGSVLSFKTLLHGVGATPFALLILSYLFWRLGDKHWKQIIGEQIVLVNVKATKLIMVAETYNPTSLVPDPGSELVGSNKSDT